MFFQQSLLCQSRHLHSIFGPRICIPSRNMVQYALEQKQERQVLPCGKFWY